MERNRNERRKTGWFGLKSKNPVSALGQEFLSEKNGQIIQKKKILYRVRVKAK